MAALTYKTVGRLIDEAVFRPGCAAIGRCGGENLRALVSQIEPGAAQLAVWAVGHGVQALAGCGRLVVDGRGALPGFAAVGGAKREYFAVTALALPATDGRDTDEAVAGHDAGAAAHAKRHVTDQRQIDGL